MLYNVNGDQSVSSPLAWVFPKGVFLESHHDYKHSRKPPQARPTDSPVAKIVCPKCFFQGM